MFNALPVVSQAVLETMTRDIAHDQSKGMEHRCETLRAEKEWIRVNQPAIHTIIELHAQLAMMNPFVGAGAVDGVAHAILGLLNAQTEVNNLENLNV